MNDILNPYIAGAPVVETSMFFGREDVFDWIERSLVGKYVDHILVLHGQRRVGKTSVLKQIPNFLPNKYIQVFFDLQGRTSTTLDRFLWWLASEIARTLKRDHAINIPKPDRKAFEDTDYFINEFLPGLKSVLGDYVLLLTFDEFDTLDRPEIQERLASPLIAYLRRLIEVEGLNFIFSIGSSGDKLENMQASYTDFFKSALYRKISFLTSDDSQRLITKPVEGLIKYEKKAVSRISDITSGHPYFTQLMCHELFSRCQRTGSRTISVDDVEAVLEDVVERGTVNLKFVWDEASDLEKWTLAALAQMDGGSNQKLAQELTAQHVRFSDSDLNSATIHLRDKDVITAENRFVIHLMRLWLVANRPMDRVREELVEVNPIANRYIEIGDEYRDRGQSKQAIESYQQALAADPGNLKAQINIASIHLDKKNYSEAAETFESALKIDDEDVVAKAGYCDSNLALGDDARGRGETDQAIAYYQKILVINAAHTDARQRLAAIYREQAESQLATGQGDEALRSFNRAMDFTPEDDQLSARYEEVSTQKKAKAVKVWLEKAEKALSRQRWDEAAEMIEAAIKVDPDNQDLQAKLAETKDSPRQFKIQSYRREAEQAIGRGNWDKAIAALETATLLAPDNKELSDWLASIRSDQHNAQLHLHLRDAEKAISAGDWEAALTARQAALKLNPDDPDLQHALEATRQAQQQAKLDSLQKQIDEAIVAGNWDAATQTIKEAIKFAPDDATWNNKLNEVEAARHKVQLEGFRSQAENARNAQNWDAAITALEAYLELEPQDEKIRAEINVLLVEKRESELKAFKAQAEKAAKAENWDEAVHAWEKYLALAPDDSDHVEEKLAHARKYARIAGDYAEAQQAMRKKRYGRAIELLQGIISKERTYKSTSRLLVEAVEANKAIPIWRRPWVLPTAGVVLLAILGIFFGPKLWKNISTALPATPEINALGTDSTETSDARIMNPANQHFYLYYGDMAKKSWHDARDYCAAQGGYLVTIQNAAENEFVHQLTGTFSWLGATDEDREGIWEWVNGETLEYTNWSDGQPDNDNREDYLAFLWPEDPSYWNDAPAAILQPFICEWDPADSDFSPAPTGNTINITSVEDSGAGSLRQALLDAQAGDTITFDSEIFPPDNPTTIFLTIQQLPSISQGGITIDASNAGVILDGSKFQGDNIFGLVINSDHNTVMGLQIINMNGIGIYLEGGSYNQIGGDRTLGTGPLGQGNLLSNNHAGIDLLSSAGGNKITGNLIGTDVSGTEPLGNRAAGVAIEDNQSYHPAPNTIGPNNVIAFNGNSDSIAGGEIPSGVRLATVLMPTTITANLIYDNLGPGIRYSQTDAPQDPPTILDFDLEAGIVTGLTCSGCIVEVFSTDTKDGKIYEGAVAANESGDFTFRKGEALSGPYLTATTRPPGGSTSEFSLSTAIQLALDTIQTQAPAYEIGFESWDFDEPEDNARRIENGKLILTSEGENVGLKLPSHSSDRFAVEFELSTLESGPDGVCYFGAANSQEDNESMRAIGTGFYENRQAFLEHFVYPVSYRIAAGEFDEIETNTNTVTLIILDDQISTFVNGQWAYTAIDPEGSVVYSVQSFSAEWNIVCEYDNYKLWDLSGVDFSPTYSALDPNIQTALDVIQNEAPTFQTSFEAGDNALDFLELGEDARMENGKLMVTSSGSHVSAGLDIPDSDRVAIEFELLLSDASPEGHCPFYTENDENGSSYRGTATVFFMSGETTFDLNMHEGIDQVPLATSTFDVSKTNRITLIILGDQAAAFIDGQLAYTASNPDMRTFYKSIHFAATFNITCEYDNYKFWDLSGVDFNP